MYQHQRLLYALGLLVVVLAGAACGRSSVKDTTYQSNSAEGKELIPSEVKIFLRDNLKGWTVADTADYSPVWWSFYNRDEIPHTLVTDLNDDQIPDYGFIVKKADSAGVAVLVSSGDTFVYFLDKAAKGPRDAQGLQIGLSNEPPGRIDCIVNGEDKSLILRSNGITRMTFELRARVYYWQDGRLNVFNIGDE